MPRFYETIVAGLGAMGSAALARCALRGAKTIGIDRYPEGHAFGASAGRSRMIRQAYYENATYVPLLLRAYDLWRDVEQRAETNLLHLTGLLLIGTPHGEILAGTLRAAAQHGLPLETLTASDIRAHYPSARVDDNEVGVYEANAGYVVPEAAIAAHLRIARDNGAQTRFGVALSHWHDRGDRVEVTCSDGSVLEARTLLLALGPWFAAEMRAAGVPLHVQRNVQVWFEPHDDRYRVGAFPAFLVDRAALPAPLYGFPDSGDGVKAAFHGHGETTDPDNLRREIDVERDVEPVRVALDAWMPSAAARYRDAKACMYALTPDEHFVIGPHPHAANVVLCGGFSGHGYKFAAVIGEIASHLALDGGTPHDIGFLSPSRFAAVSS